VFTANDACGRLQTLMNIEWHIGDVIENLRKRRRMNQEQLAKAVGVNKATIVRVEDADPKVARGTYLEVARVLGTTLASLEMEAERLASTPKETSRGDESPTAGRLHRTGTDGERKPNDPSR
jgi:DNA-binding XRE family transcriptional regulator